jgi:uncharacterized protein with FMN-binding domain
MDGQQNNTGESKKNNGVMIGTVVALIVAVASYGFYKYTKKEEVAIEPVVVPPTAPTTTEPSTQPTVSFVYKNGEYTAVGNYNSPGGAETVSVKVTLKDDMVTAVSLTPNATRPVSLKMQQAVAGSLNSLVVGKKLNEVSLDKVSGSSLTPKGFNDAIAKIKVSAKA